MKIAYLAIHLDQQYLNGGVGEKIFSHISMWKQAGNHVRFFLHTPDEIAFPDTTTYSYNRANPAGLWGRIRLEVERIKALARLISDLRSFAPDIIYLRYGLFSLPLQKIFGIAPVVVELNTNDVYEYRLRSLFFYIYNAITRNFILQPAAGLVSVSHEIHNLPFNIALNKPTMVIGNGIDLASITPLPAPNNDIPHLIFVGTPGAIWQGFEEVVRLGAVCDDLLIDIVGIDRLSNSEVPVTANVKFHGFLRREELLAVLSTADCAMGTAALHKKKMNEAPSLKVRQYLAYGIPTILPYIDTDLMACDLDTLLTIPNEPDALINNADTIRDFVYRMRGRRIERDLVTPLIDQSIKERRKLVFFEEILHRIR